MNKLHERRGLTMPRRLYYTTAALLFAASVAALSLGEFAGAAGLFGAGLCYLTMPPTLRNVYRAAWLRGRGAMIEAMIEAQERGLSFTQFVLAEAERDGVIPPQ